MRTQIGSRPRPSLVCMFDQARHAQKQPGQDLRCVGVPNQNPCSDPSCIVDDVLDRLVDRAQHLGTE